IEMEYIASTERPSQLGDFPEFQTHRVRWKAFAEVFGEGLLLTPSKSRPPVVDVILVPDAGVAPEQLLGTSPGFDVQSQYARRLAEHGCRGIVPRRLH